MKKGLKFLSCYNNKTLNSQINKDSIELYIKWETKIAKYTHLRGGLYNKNSWLIPYWYPQIAVYDDIFGWDRVQHSGNEEFYFEFANYDVKLSMSNAMCVWATGTLQNPQKIFNKKIYKKYLQALNSDNEIDIISKDDIHNVLKNTENVWHFKADSVLDFVLSTFFTTFNNFICHLNDFFIAV